MTEGTLGVRVELPGTVAAVAVTPGTAVAAGAELLRLDSMKMDIPVRAPQAGTVRRVLVGVGDRLQQGDLAVVLDLP
ncbi:biotin/lipoyl-containing protein [Sporichthya polymorpha]|uniref:biotin/lipoyl-containing protein n=1 Tax=Sporichthya polymorpha TaxID=35751 RepID=UPI0003816CF8|nr:biotin/lipoyl-containing protein [Sporichthya polymorpha]